MNAEKEAFVTPCLRVDWGRAWLAPYAGHSVTATQGLLLAGSVADGLNACGTAPVRFVAQTALPPGQAYEQFIFETATVPTRDDLHDFFNGLCWLTFPLAKAKLNLLQAAEIAVAGVGQVRGPVRDALTLFDENAALLSAPPALWDALLARQWRRVFVDLRPLWADAQLVLFGHALLEKLVSPRKPITAHVYRAPVAINSIAKLDAWLADDLNAGKLSGKPFSPLPVLGVPGWWPENENFSFYDDSVVFRPLPPITTIKNSARQTWRKP
ncbi:MAG: hypothetical protein JWP47_2923 [Polaromonas sp.]|nr:hypothetical protein [Polaromonas sp.]